MKKECFILSSIVFLMVHSMFSQTVNPLKKHTLYVKLERPIEVDKTILSNIQKSFPAIFIKDKLLSKVIKGNVYKVKSQIKDIKKLHKLNYLLKNQKGVLYTSLLVNKPPRPPNDIAPTTTDFVNSQGYINENPGVNAMYAWQNGANGIGITVRTIEYGLDVDHEEFVGRSAKIADNMTVSTEASFSFTTHGTATAGIVFSDDGGYGTKGIAYSASDYILYPEWQQGVAWNRIEAITNAVNEAKPGDIIIYEMQVGDINGDFVMAEYDQLVWDLTKSATDNGAIVVAAAGNGGRNLDDPLYNDYNNRGDSGAIIVGAGTSDLNHNTESFSTYGTRVDVQAWGANVFTTGYGDIQFGNDVHQYYTDSFGGTSSATAIIGGCVAALQSYYFSLTNSYMTSVEMRNLLKDTGYPQTNTSFPIGPFPNLKKAMEKIDASLSIKDESIASFHIFPNPVNDILTIKQLTVEPKLVTVYDVLGKKLLQTLIDEKLNSLSLSSLSNGVYYVKITFNKRAIIKKILKN